MLSAPAAASCPPSGLNATASIFCWLWPTKRLDRGTRRRVPDAHGAVDARRRDPVVRREDDVVDRGLVTDEQVQLAPRRRLPDVSVPAAGCSQILPVGRKRGIRRLTRLRRVGDEVAGRDGVHADHGIARQHGRREEPAGAHRDRSGRRGSPVIVRSSAPVAVSQILRLFAPSPRSTSRPPFANTTSSTLAPSRNDCDQLAGGDVVEDDATVARARGEQAARRGHRGRRGRGAECERRDRRAERVRLQHRVIARPEDTEVAAVPTPRPGRDEVAVGAEARRRSTGPLPPWKIARTCNACSAPRRASSTSFDDGEPRRRERRLHALYRVGVEFGAGGGDELADLVLLRRLLVQLRLLLGHAPLANRVCLALLRLVRALGRGRALACACCWLGHSLLLALLRLLGARVRLLLALLRLRGVGIRTLLLSDRVELRRQRGIRRFLRDPLLTECVPRLCQRSAPLSRRVRAQRDGPDREPCHRRGPSSSAATANAVTRRRRRRSRSSASCAVKLRRHASTGSARTSWKIS